MKTGKPFSLTNVTCYVSLIPFVLIAAVVATKGLKLFLFPYFTDQVLGGMLFMFLVGMAFFNITLSGVIELSSGAPAARKTKIPAVSLAVQFAGVLVLAAILFDLPALFI